MHILGISAGTLNGNSEVLLKAALQAAEQAKPGITTSMARIRYMQAPRNGKPIPQSIVPHITAYKPDAPGSHDIDDRPHLYEAIMEADAIIISTPVYSHLPPGHIKCFIDDTLGPGTDISLALATDEEGAGLGRKPRASIDPRLFKPRVSAFMVVAGSPADMPEQWTLGLVALHQSLYSIQATTVDQVCFKGYGPPGSVCTNEQNTIARAQLLGRRLSSQLGQPIGEAQFLGESQEGSCPYCHLLTISFIKKDQIMCTTCGARGRLSVLSDGSFKPEWEANSGVSHLTLRGKRKHVGDLIANSSKGVPDQSAQERYAYWRGLDVKLVGESQRSKI
ncbi:putative NADPH-dependent FMN reductase-like domain-containing protein [Seiridium cardinale]